jgi:hypothetical protein
MNTGTAAVCKICDKREKYKDSKNLAYEQHLRLMKWHNNKTEKLKN